MVIVEIEVMSWLLTIPSLFHYHYFMNLLLAPLWRDSMYTFLTWLSKPCILSNHLSEGKFSIQFSSHLFPCTHINPSGEERSPAMLAVTTQRPEIWSSLLFYQQYLSFGDSCLWWINIILLTDFPKSDIYSVFFSCSNIHSLMLLINVMPVDHSTILNQTQDVEES